jgi:hypothetical protein
MTRIKYCLLVIFIMLLTTITTFSQQTRPFDEAIDRIIKKIRQYPERTKDLPELKENVDMANAIDLNRIDSLKKTGQPGIWLDVYKSYMSLENRQLRVMEIPEKSLKLAGIETVDYQRDLKESKFRASAYHYALGEKLLATDSREDAQKAYVEFMTVAKLDPAFNEVDKQLRKAILKGSTNVEFELHNRTGQEISKSMVAQLTEIIWQFKKAKYGQNKPDSTDNSFTFILSVVLDDLVISADKYKELQYEEQRDVYREGAVVDTIDCLVTETRQLKVAALAGSIEYIDKQSGMVVNRVPVKVESVFRNSYGSLQGNPDAAGDDTRELLKSKKTDYPSSQRMIQDATQEFCKKAAEIIQAE